MCLEYEGAQLRMCLVIYSFLDQTWVIYFMMGSIASYYYFWAMIG